LHVLDGSRVACRLLRQGIIDFCFAPLITNSSLLGRPLLPSGAKLTGWLPCRFPDEKRGSDHLKVIDITR
jgi:hypothetical protein